MNCLSAAACYFAVPDLHWLNTTQAVFSSRFSLASHCSSKLCVCFCALNSLSQWRKSLEIELLCKFVLLQWQSNLLLRAIDYGMGARLVLKHKFVFFLCVTSKYQTVSEWSFLTGM